MAKPSFLHEMSILMFVCFCFWCVCKYLAMSSVYRYLLCWYSLLQNGADLIVQGTINKFTPKGSESSTTGPLLLMWLENLTIQVHSSGLWLKPSWLMQARGCVLSCFHIPKLSPFMPLHSLAKNVKAWWFHTAELTMCLQQESHVIDQHWPPKTIIKNTALWLQCICH